MSDLRCPNCGASASLPLGMTCSDHQPRPICPECNGTGVIVYANALGERMSNMACSACILDPGASPAGITGADLRARYRPDAGRVVVRVLLVVAVIAATIIATVACT